MICHRVFKIKPLAAVFFMLSACACAIADEPAHIRDFVVKSCAECHDADSKKGGLDLTSLKMDFADQSAFDKWVYVFDRVSGGEMPPPKKKQPERAEKDAAMQSLAAALTAADRTRQAMQGRSSLRRLSRVEFENSLRDLLALPGLRLKEDLPADGKSHGFDRLSDALDMSFAHMESYLEAVDKALNSALCSFPERPPVFKHRYQPWEETTFESLVRQKEAIGMIGMQRDPTFVLKYPVIIDDDPKATAIGVFRHEDADHRYSLRKIAPVLSGWHKIRISGYSFQWDGKDIVPTDRHGALSFGIFSTDAHFGTVDLPPNKPEVREVTAWLDRGGGMTAGTDDSLRVSPESVYGFRDFFNTKVPDPGIVHGPFQPTPGVALEWIEIEGPIYDQWPPASHVALFGNLPVKLWTAEDGVKPTQQVWPRGNPHTSPKDIYGEREKNRLPVFVESKDSPGDAKRLLGTFLRRAFRRPVSEKGLAGYVAEVTRRMENGEAFQDAMLKAYRAALVSPDFILMRAPAGKLDDYALASRLSSFLWSSIPDEELLGLADKGELSKPDVLRAQTERMLSDPKGKRFIEDFTGQWLGLNDINATQPDKKLYPEFMPWLAASMVMETHAFFSELLEKNLGAVNIVKSDFAMLNEPLAEHYGIEGVRGWDIRRVKLPVGCRRGGFLTQASILKVTAAGTTTSPVKRGVFVLEKILGIVPKPPPPDAGAIEPDVQGATTIREQLDKHRRNATCAGCHAKMDGYGFALESFDVMGGWRDRYRAVDHPKNKRDRTYVKGHWKQYHLALPVDCKGVLPDGRTFADVDELRDLLAADPERLARAFTEQLITYATGAEISFADREVVEDILKRTKKDNYGLRSILHEVVQSELFRNK